MKYGIFLYLLIFWCATAPLHADETIRVCTYNVLNFSVSNEDGRSEQFNHIFGEIRPDILIVQEMVDEQGSNYFFENAIKLPHWKQAFFYKDEEDTENQLYYDTTRLDLLDVQHIQSAGRDITEYTLFVKPLQDILTVYSVHLKAGDTNADASARSAEIDSLFAYVKVHIPDTRNNMLIVGDCNFYETSEAAYTKILNFAAPQIVDPLGSWVRNQATYSSFYTQSPRMVANAACGGGVGGGMDDRFDFIFASDKMMQYYLPGSYTVFGNDNLNRLNSPINDPVNIKVDESTANALQCASDHLPVFADFVFPSTTSLEEQLTMGFNMRIYPIPMTDETVAEFMLPNTGYISFTISDLLGHTVYSYSQVTEKGIYTHRLQRLSPGIYVGRASGSYSASQIIVVQK